MARRPKCDQPSLLEVKTSTAPCVPAIRKEVRDWRAAGYMGATKTTRSLLDYWFRNDHRLPNGRRFEYHYAQREAIETLIYLYEVAKIRRQKELVEGYASQADLKLLQKDDFPRYGVKMATGSGKTKVMSLAIAWQYLNAVLEDEDDYSRSFLLIAPNVIVFERLRTDFAGGRIFRVDPLIPPELSIYWDFDCYMRLDSEKASSQGALYLTNVQQLYQRSESNTTDEPESMTAVLGPKPPARMAESSDFLARLASRSGRCLVINDEAHHTHDEQSEWNAVIRRLHDSLSPCSVAQLDFSATPRHSKGTLFTWVVFDYPLKQAIIDNIVKRPVKGVAAGIQEQPSDIASVRYQSYLTAGVERWKEYRDQLAPLGKRPLLFVMLNETSDADDVGEYLRVKYPSEFGGDRLLVIHTDRSGEVSKKDLDRAREVARAVDDAESPVNAIVSVLMLREGWDVQNVTVVVGLRPYSSKANILPEQTIGRGLRLMFRDLGSTYQERVDIIGNKTFLEFVEQLEKEEDIQLETFQVGKDRLAIVTIAPEPERAAYDITMPRLTPILERKKTLAEEIAGLDMSAMTLERPLPRKEGDSAAKNFHYEGYDLLTLQKLIERDYTIPDPQTPQEVISYYARRIARDVRLPSQFAALVPKVREFLETRAFGQEVDLDSPQMIRAISSNVAHYVTVKTFSSALRGLMVTELTPRLAGEDRKLSQTPPFPYSRPTIQAAKTVFNRVPCDNEFERKFAKFLEDSPDVLRFAKLPSQFGLVIEYTDSSNNLRFYEPDFVAVADTDVHHLIETKGREDIDVKHKDRAARIWCENATLLTDTEWIYIKVPQAEFEKLQATDLSDLLALAP